MTMPDERARAVIETKQFLKELCQNPSLPTDIREQAKSLLRHYPDEHDVKLLAELESHVFGSEPDERKRDFFMAIYAPRFWYADRSTS